MSLEHFQAERAPLCVDRLRSGEEPHSGSRAGFPRPADAPGGRLDVLRRAIARVEAGGALPAPRVSLGAPGFDFLLRGGLRRGALHEIAPGGAGDGAAACGFALALAARLGAGAPAGRSAVVWIVEDFAGREGGAPYGPGLALHGLDPAGLVLIRTAGAKDSLWAMEEALRCRAVAAAIGEIWTLEKVYGLAAARRLARAAQAGGGCALVLAAGMAGGADRLASCAHTRFEVRAQRGSSGSGPLPGLPLPGLARWSVRIVKARDPPRANAAALLWDHAEARFRDAFPLRLPADAGDRPDHPADARARPRAAG